MQKVNKMENAKSKKMVVTVTVDGVVVDEFIHEPNQKVHMFHRFQKMVSSVLGGGSFVDWMTKPPMNPPVPTQNTYGIGDLNLIANALMADARYWDNFAAEEAIASNLYPDLGATVKYREYAANSRALADKIVADTLAETKHAFDNNCTARPIVLIPKE